jgi:hypothetical protein
MPPDRKTTAKKTIERSDGVARHQWYQRAILVSSSKFLFNDKHSLLVRLDVPKAELYVKKKRAGLPMKENCFFLILSIP